MNALDKAIKTIDAYSYKSAYQDLERAYRMHKNNKPLLKDMIKQWADRHPEKEAKQALKDFEKQHGKMTDKAVKNMDKSYLVEYVGRNNKKQTKRFDKEKDAFDFTKKLDNQIKNGTCLGYNLTEF